VREETCSVVESLQQRVKRKPVNGAARCANAKSAARCCASINAVRPKAQQFVRPGFVQRSTKRDRNGRIECRGVSAWARGRGGGR